MSEKYRSTAVGEKNMPRIATDLQKFLDAFRLANQLIIARGGVPMKLGTHDYQRLDPNKRNPI